MPYKIRVNKKKETAPIRIVNRSEEMFEQVRTNPKWIWIGAGVILAVAAILLTVQILNHNTEKKAAALEAEASALFHEPPPIPQPIEEGKEAPKELTKTERLQKSAALYDEIVAKYPGTSTAMVAQYESGNVYFELEDNEAANQRYLSFLQKHPDQKQLAALVHLKLAYLNQKKGDLPSAMNQFKAAYDMEDGHSRDQAGFELGRALEQTGKKEEAVAIYKKLSEGSGQSPWAAEATARLVVLTPPAAALPPAAVPGKEESAPPALSGQPFDKPAGQK